MVTRARGYIRITIMSAATPITMIIRIITNGTINNNRVIIGCIIMIKTIICNIIIFVMVAISVFPIHITGAELVFKGGSAPLLPERRVQTIPEHQNPDTNLTTSTSSSSSPSC